MDEWHGETLGPARRLRGGRGGRWDPAPRLGAEQQLSEPGLHKHRQSLLRSAEDHTHTHTHTFESPSGKAEKHAEKGWLARGTTSMSLNEDKK